MFKNFFEIKKNYQSDYQEEKAGKLTAIFFHKQYIIQLELP